MRPVVRYGVGCLLVAGLLCAVALVGTAAAHSTSVLGPVFTPDGSAIVAVRREQAALDEPGVEVEYRGPYILRQQRATSAAPNGFLAGGGNRYFVETSDGVAEIRLVPRRDAGR